MTKQQTDMLLRETVKLMLEFNIGRLFSTDVDLVGDATAAATAANIKFFAGDKDKVISTTPASQLPASVVAAHNMFKEVVKEYLGFWTTQPIAQGEEFALPKVKPGASFFDTEADKKSFEDNVVKYKAMFTTSRTPKAKSLFDFLINKKQFEENAALKACFLVVKLIQDIKFGAVWGSADAYSKIRKAMSAKNHKEDEEHGPLDTKAAASCHSQGGQSLVLVNCNTSVTRDVMVHEVGHAQKNMQREVIYSFEKDAESDPLTKTWAFKTPYSKFTKDQLLAPVSSIGSENIVELMGNLNASQEELYRRFEDFSKNVPEPALVPTEKKTVKNKKGKSTVVENPDRGYIFWMLALGNYTLYQAARVSFTNFPKDFSLDQKYVKDETTGQKYVPYKTVNLPGNKIDDEYLRWIATGDEAINYFRVIDFENRKLERDRGVAYKNLQDVRAELWKSLKQSQAGQHPALYAILGLMPPKKSSDLLGLTAVAVNDPKDEDSGDESALAEARSLASFARSYLIDRTQENNMRITANQLRRIIREELERMDEKSKSGLKPEIKSLLDKYYKDMDTLAKNTPSKDFEAKKKPIEIKLAKDFKAADVTGDAVSGQVSAYQQEHGDGPSEGGASLAATIVRYQEQVQEAVRRLLRRL